MNLTDIPTDTLRRELARRTQEPIANDKRATKILNYIAKRSGVTVDQVLAPTRGSAIAAKARRDYAMALRNLGYTNPEIGAHIGRRDRHSISWMLKQWKREH